jgi:uncharacterized CHY-type Zn-finger protein
MSDVEVRGATIDDETRCEHYDGERDVVAFQFACCGEWYPCRACHDEAVDHATETWGPGDVGEHAVLCGVCRTALTIDTYVACGHTCPYCGASFNPGCREHWTLYFDPPT